MVIIPPITSDLRLRLVRHAGLSEEPRRLEQVSGSDVANAPDVKQKVIEPDTVFPDQTDQICGPMAEDCVPTLLAGKNGSCVVVIHVGCRGLAVGTIEDTVKCLSVSPEEYVTETGRIY